MYVNMANNRSITFSSPLIKKEEKLDPRDNSGDRVSDKYDYQVWDATGLDLDNQIYFKNTYGIPEFAKPNGKFRVTKILSFANQKKGMIVCKSGAVTGISCGEIINANATHDDVSGWIRVGNSKQPNISAGGDSGGPWFVYPGKSTNITAVGIHTAGRDNPDDATYMPIEYIYDNNNLSISLILK